MAKMSYGELLEPYSFRRDFDYWKHLETRSHFDVMSDRIDQSILKLGLSQAEIAELTTTRMGEQMRDLAGSISAGQDRVVDELRSGFRDMGAGLDRVADSVDRVRDSVDDVRFAVENGFRLTEKRLSSIEHVLSDLLEAVRSPERTWALEQYATARDLYRREYYREALEYLDLAISGDASNRGYRFDPQFHLLKGTILLGDRENLDRTLIDPRAARAAFEEAVKYAKPPRDMLDAADEARRVELLQPRCFALCCSGWASYVVGDMAEAERSYRAAVADCPNDAHANYYLAKVLAHQDRHEEAAKHLLGALKSAPLLSIQVSADADYLRDSNRYMKLVHSINSEMASELRPLASLILKVEAVKPSFGVPPRTYGKEVPTLAGFLSRFEERITAGWTSLDAGIAPLLREIDQGASSISDMTLNRSAVISYFASAGANLNLANRELVDLLSNILRIRPSEVTGDARSYGREYGVDKAEVKEVVSGHRKIGLRLAAAAFALAFVNEIVLGQSKGFFNPLMGIAIIALLIYAIVYAPFAGYLAGNTMREKAIALDRESSISRDMARQKSLEIEGELRKMKARIELILDGFRAIQRKLMIP